MTRLLFALMAVPLFAAPSLSAEPIRPDGAKAITFPFPAKTPLVVTLHGYDKARERLSKMLTTALPADAPKITQLLDDGLAQILEGRKLDAIRKDARLYLAVNDLSSLFDDAPAISLLVPVTTYKEFQDTFLTKAELRSIDRGRDGVDALKTVATGEEMPVYLVDLKDHVAVCLDRMTAEAFAAKFVAATTDVMGGDLAESFLKADLALFVNMDVINAHYGDQIRGVKGFIDFGLMPAEQQGMLPGLSRKQIEAVKVILKGAFQGVEDARALVVSAEFRPEGLFLQIQARFAENSPSAKLLAQELPATLVEVNKLPTGFTIYQASRLGRTLSDLLREIGQQFSTTEDDARGAELIELHLKDLAAAGLESDFTASTQGGEAIAVTEFRDAAMAQKALTKAYKAVAAGGRVNGVVVKFAPRVADEYETYRKFSFSEVNLKYDFDATVAGLPDGVRQQTLQTLKRTVQEKTTLWIGNNGKVVVQLTAKDWDAARRVFDSYLDAKPIVGSEPGFKLTRSQLPEQANLILIGETGGVLTMLLESTRALEDQIPGFPKIPALKPVKGPPTYVGLGVTLKGETATITAFVPGSAIAAGRKMLEGLFKNIE